MIFSILNRIRNFAESGVAPAAAAPAALFLTAALAIAGVRAGAASPADDILAESGARGGLVLCIGDGAIETAPAIAAAGPFAVCALDSDAAAVERTRAAFGANQTGAAAVMKPGAIPFIDNVANCIALTDPALASAEECLRVLRPGGVLLAREGGAWRKTIKPWPAGIDEWTHYLHGPNNNAVARDSAVDVPFYLQWSAEPKWARHHNFLSSTSAMATANGRVFAIMDEGPKSDIEADPEWFLTARDAFNGVLLWKRAIGPWEGHLRPFRSGPTELQRRLVAGAERVFVTLGYNERVAALDAATGEIVHEYDGTDGALEILLAGGTLYLALGDIDAAAYAKAMERRGASPPPRNKRIMALDADSGRIFWTKADADSAEMFPTSLCLENGRLFFHALDALVCLDARSGETLWRAERAVLRARLSWAVPTVVAYGEMVYCADAAPPADANNDPAGQTQWEVTSKSQKGPEAEGELIAYSAQDGREAWRCPAALGYNSPPDVFVADGLVWHNAHAALAETDFTAGRDPRTGEIVREIDTAEAFDSAHHHRCYRNKATDRFILLGRAGTEFISLAGAESAEARAAAMRRNYWIRGACQYGVMPANGMIYFPPHSCACYIQSKLSGYQALAPRTAQADFAEPSDAERLEKGEAYGSAEPAAAREGDWPTYRHDAERSGRASAFVATPLETGWKQPIGGRLSAPTIAEGVALAASTDQGRIHAFDAESGQPLWSFQAGGRIDSPPTIHAGTALFGSADGYVYCLRLADGALAWRFLAAAADRRLVAEDRIESVWPVTGSVLVVDGTVYCTAGRSSYLDGGMILWALDARTGAARMRRTLYDRDPETGAQPQERALDVELPGKLPDVLSFDGESLYLRDVRMNLEGEELPPEKPHLYSSVGFLDGEWWHRTYLIFGTAMFGRASGWHIVGNMVPSGRAIVLDDETLFGYGQKRYSGSEQGTGGSAMQFYKASKQTKPLALKGNVSSNVAQQQRLAPSTVDYHWTREAPMLARAMVLAGDAVFAAGPPWREGQAPPNIDIDGKGVLMAFAAADGAELYSLALDSRPVHDGMAAANGRLYLAAMNGELLCLKPSTK
ncbi:MAG: Serine/threonine-protein kinase AfsK [candidate division BRC1 bacterium ADurb.BinA364]|nr:MAG: Serine/threonine-protein kinase AfsK [candidate division BRC1 bacterium ADurb.BinA364]